MSIRKQSNKENIKLFDEGEGRGPVEEAAAS
jgi:hypothetical protein